MNILELNSFATAPILDYQALSAHSASIGEGSGEIHIHWLRFEPGGKIGPHPAGFAQLFVPVAGSGWAAGADGQRRAITPGEAALFARDEVHSKGSDVGMSALMIQVSAFALGLPS